VVGSCEYSNETSGSIEGGEFLEQFLKKDSTPWSTVLTPPTHSRQNGFRVSGQGRFALLFKNYYINNWMTMTWQDNNDSEDLATSIFREEVWTSDILHNTTRRHNPKEFDLNNKEEHTYSVTET
jgi:hypothetical protein